MQGNVGLGTSNILSMACELLLHKEAEKTNRSSFLLIEEPEAHIHAQRQLKLVQSLEEAPANQQIIITTHSPLLASVVKLGNIIIIKDGKTFSLAEGKTKLESDDYWFLEKYLDATKANLFFARSVIIVEGPGEALLLPALASLLGHSFTDYGVSLVDVRGVGLRRYAKIFKELMNLIFLMLGLHVLQIEMLCLIVLRPYALMKNTPVTVHLGLINQTANGEQKVILLQQKPRVTLRK